MKPVKRRDPFPIGDALSELTGAVQPPSVLAEVQRCWPEAVGEVIANWAAPVSERNGTLTISCRDAIVAHELEMMKVTLIEQLAETVSMGTIRELRFIIS